MTFCICQELELAFGGGCRLPRLTHITSVILNHGGAEDTEKSYCKRYLATDYSDFLLLQEKSNCKRVIRRSWNFHRLKDFSRIGWRILFNA